MIKNTKNRAAPCAPKILATVLFVYSAAVRSSAFSARTARRDSFVFLFIYDRRRAPGTLPCRALKQYNRRDRRNFSVLPP